MAAITKINRWIRSNAVHRMLFDTSLSEGLVKQFENDLLLAGKFAVRYWKDRILPKHFEHSAHVRYEYHTRKRWYINYKVYRYPQSKGLDLVLTGNLHERALGPPRTEATGRSVQTPDLGFVFKIGVMTTPYTTLNPYVNMHKELTASDRQDVLEVFGVLKEFVELLFFGKKLS